MEAIGTLTGFAGFCVVRLACMFQHVLLSFPFFTAPRAPEPAGIPAHYRQWWVGLIVGGRFPVSFLPLMIVGGRRAPASRSSHTFINQVTVWSGHFLIPRWLMFISLGEQAAFTTAWLSSIAIGVATVGIGYLSLVIVDAVFHVDFRFWVLALKLISPWQFKSFLLYLIPFGIFFFFTLRGLQSDLAVRHQGWFAHYAATKLAMCGGVALLLVAEYLPMATGDHLLLRADPLHPIMADPFVPILAIVGVISTYTYRRTNSYVPGAVAADLVRHLVCRRRHRNHDRLGEACRREKAGAGSHRGQDRAPGDVQDGQVHRPDLQGRHVGQVVGHVGEEAERRAHQRRRPATAAQGGRRGEQQDAQNIKDIEQHSRRHVGVLGQ